ncbi:MAG: DinB family protein [Candidatus Limnocylindrales bacterium]
MTTPDPNVAAEPAYADRLTRAASEIGALREPIDAARPWPLKLISGDGPEAEWGSPEILAHVAEALQYWLGELERVVDGTSEPVAFGRVATDPLRTMTIERDRTLPPGELISRIQTSVGRYAARLPQLSAADWQKRGIHPRLGEMTVAEILPRFVVGHVEEHVVQLREAIAARTTH